MKYPNITQYKEAIQDLDSFNELSESISAKMNGHEPFFASGNFAAVFKMRKNIKYYALKCFLKHDPNRNIRQKKIVSYIKENPSKHFIEYRYYEKELWVNDDDYPVAWMEWIDSPTLGEKINEYCQNDDNLSLIELATKFKEFALWIIGQPFAHGDLKHDNLLVKDNGDIVMVDYDGMFIPNFQGEATSELGGKSYQHPDRSYLTFNSNLDDFSLLIIYTSLIALSQSTKLYKEFNNGQNIIFESSDYRDFYNSRIRHDIKFKGMDTNDCKLSYENVNIIPLLDTIEKSLNSSSIEIKTLPSILLGIEIINFNSTVTFRFKGEDQQIEIYSSKVRGFQYRYDVETLNEMKIGDRLELVEEPKNKYDVNAIAIYFKGKHIGYIPKEDNVKIGALIDQNISLIGEIKQINKDEIQPCEIALYVGINKKENEKNVLTEEWWENLPEVWKKLFLFNIDFSPKIDKKGVKVFHFYLQPLEDMYSVELGQEYKELVNYSPKIILTKLSKIHRFFIDTDSSEEIYKTSDLIPLSELKNLISIAIDSNKSPLTPLSKLVDLDKLYLIRNTVKELFPISKLDKITVLHLAGNELTNIEFLSGLKNLHILTLNHNQISNIESLLDLKNLHELYLDNNQLSNIESLLDLKNLHILTLDHNQISNIESLFNLKKLRELSISHNQISDVEPLSGLKSLHELVLSSNQISTIEPLSNLKDLQRLLLSSNEISNIKPLSNLRNLSEIKLQNNQISNLDPLSNLKNFHRFSLQGLVMTALKRQGGEKFY